METERAPTHPPPEIEPSSRWAKLRRWADRAHAVQIVIGFIIAAGTATLITCRYVGDIVTHNALEQTLGPLQQHIQRVDDYTQSMSRELAHIDGVLEGMSTNVYRTGRQVGAPVIPPSSNHADAGVP